MPGRVAIFIDGAYLQHTLRREFGAARIRYQEFSKAAAGESDILRTYYYDCPPYQGNPPTEPEKERYSRFRSFVTALERLPRYTVRLGRLAYRGLDRDGNKVYEQKRVDILLGVDMVQLAAKQNIQEAILVAGDSDFIPAVVAAKSEGVLVRLFHGAKPHNDLWQECDERTQLTSAFIDSIRR